MNSKSICTCQGCDQLFCAECSDAAHPWEFCSDNCERNILREQVDNESLVFKLSGLKGSGLKKKFKRS